MNCTTWFNRRICLILSIGRWMLIQFPIDMRNHRPSIIMTEMEMAAETTGTGKRTNLSEWLTWKPIDHYDLWRFVGERNIMPSRGATTQMRQEKTLVCHPIVESRGGVDHRPRMIDWEERLALAVASINTMSKTIFTSLLHLASSLASLHLRGSSWSP